MVTALLYELTEFQPTYFDCQVPWEELYADNYITVIHVACYDKQLHNLSG